MYGGHGVADEIEGYERIAFLGQGAAGDVWRVREVRTGRHLALKVCRSGDASERRQFRQEAWALSRVSHPGVVAFAGYHEDVDGIPHLLMSLVEGSDLPIPQTEAQVRQWLPRLVAALDHLHRQGHVHGDLKPANLRLDADGQITLMDLGLLRPVGQVGSIQGTPAYMAPEVALGRPVDGRVDLYALGCVLFQVLSGRLPYEGHDATSLIRQHLTAAVPELVPATGDLSAGMRHAIRRLLARDPGERYPTGAAFLRELGLPAADPDPFVHIEPVLVDPGALRVTLEGLFADASPQPAGIALSGEAWMGKTRWLQEAAALARLEGFLVSLLAPAGEASSLATWLRDLLARVPEAVREVTLPHVARQVPGLEHLASAALEGPAERIRFQDAVATLAEAVPVPLAILVDDCSGFDPDTLALLEHLRMRGANRRWRWVVTDRHEAALSWPVTSLLPLDADEVALLAGSLVEGGSLPRLAVDTLVTGTAGVPGAIVSTVRDWLARKVLDWVGQGWDVPLPERLVARAREAADVETWRRSVDPALWRVLEALVTLGNRVALSELAGTVGEALESCLDALHAARAAGWVVLDRDSCRFAYPELAIAVRDGMSADEARTWHARALEVLWPPASPEAPSSSLEPAFALRVARHALESGQPGRGWSVFLRLVEEAFEAGTFRGVASLVEAWFQSDDHDPGRSPLVRSLHATALRRLGRLDEALALLDDGALDALHAVDPEAHAEQIVSRGILLQMKGRYDEARLALERGEHLALSGGWTSTAIRARFYRGRVAYFSGDPGAAIVALEEAIALAREASCEALVPGILSLLGYLRVSQPGADAEQGLMELRAAVEASRRVGNLYAEADALGNLGNAWLSAGRFDEAGPAFQEGLELCERMADRQELIFAELNLATVQFHRGRWPEARERCERALALARAQHRAFPEAYCLGLAGLMDLATGAPEVGLARLDEAERLARQVGNHHLDLELVAFRAEACRVLGDRSGAAAVLLTVGGATGELSGNRLAQGVRAWLAESDEPELLAPESTGMAVPERPDLAVAWHLARLRQAVKAGDGALREQELARAVASSRAAGLDLHRLELVLFEDAPDEDVAAAAEAAGHAVLAARARIVAGARPGGDRLGAQAARRWLDEWLLRLPEHLRAGAREALDLPVAPSAVRDGSGFETLARLMELAGEGDGLDAAMQHVVAAFGECFDAGEAHLLLMTNFEVVQQATWRHPDMRPDDLVLDLARATYWEGEPVHRIGPDGRARGGIPLFDGETLVGVVVVERADLDTATWEVALGPTGWLARQAGRSLARTREGDRLRAAHADARAIAALSEELLAVPDLPGKMALLAAAALRWSGAERMLWILPGQAGRPVCQAAWGDRGELSSGAQRFSTTLSSWALERREPIFMLDAQDDDTFKGQLSVMALGLRSVYGLPVMRGETCLGLLYLDLQHVVASGAELLPRLTSLARLWAACLQGEA